jgi:hypothetical protein
VTLLVAEVASVVSRSGSAVCGECNIVGIMINVGGREIGFVENKFQGETEKF